MDFKWKPYVYENDRPAPSLFFLNYARGCGLCIEKCLPSVIEWCPDTLPLMAQQQLNHG